MLGTHKNAAEMVDLYVDLINRFPSIIALIDPFRKEVTGVTLNFITAQSKISFFWLGHWKHCHLGWGGGAFLQHR